MRYLFLCIFLIISMLIYSQNIHESNRLKVVDTSRTITGKVIGLEYSLDGDCEIKVMLDSVYTCLLNNCNITKKGKCLVCEVVCAGKSIFMECKGYINNIIVPRKGDHVLITGPYVYDKRHKWMEIHPIKYIRIINNL